MAARESEINASTAPEILYWGFAEFHGLRDIEARVRCSIESDDLASVSVTAINDHVSVDIRMYRLPAANASFGDDVQFFAQAKKTWPLPNGRAFDANILAPSSVPTTWQHRAIQTSADQPGILHVWRGDDRALLIRYTFDHNSLLAHSMVRWASKRIVVLEEPWRFDLPKSGTT